MLILRAVLLAGWLSATAGGAASETCRVALTLALDVSSSVDAGEHRLQIDGLASALRHPEVREAILLPGMSVALQVFEWSGKEQQNVIRDWVAVASAADLDRLAADLETHERSFLGGQTALGHALDFALTQIMRGPDCWARKIDVSGDGQTNEGPRPHDLYWRRSFGDVVVNGLAIEAHVAGLYEYYRDFVIRGPEAFAIRADNYADFERAMREKLVRELGVPQIGMARSR